MFKRMMGWKKRHSWFYLLMVLNSGRFKSVVVVHDPKASGLFPQHCPLWCKELLGTTMVEQVCFLLQSNRGCSTTIYLGKPTSGFGTQEWEQCGAG